MNNFNNLRYHPSRSCTLSIAMQLNLHSDIQGTSATLALTDFIGWALNNLSISQNLRDGHRRRDPHRW